MSSYVVLARKWRPSQFSDIGGQGPVVRTLMNAIQSERIHHAYLLTGSRGIGKTSIARIFAKTIRCPNVKWDGTWLKNCDTCSSCKEISAGNSVDVIEIDGASNNGVDAVREIRENAKFLPSSGTRKIYIIDEVHMLTTQAFNALLKTLEEPPAHVLFILATTEPQKIPGTILSRCQRFDLKRFTVAQVAARLEEVANAEKITIDQGALALLARAADGSMRDALSLFDQVIAFSGMNVSAVAVRESIGLIEGQSLLAILKGVFTRDAKSALEVVNETYRAGHDLKLLAKNLLEYLHAALLTKVGIESSGLELSPEELSELKKITAHRELEEIELFFQAFQNGIEWIARSPQPKLVLEVLIVKCATAEALISVSGSGAGGTGGMKTSKSVSSVPKTGGMTASGVEPSPQEQSVQAVIESLAEKSTAPSVEKAWTPQKLSTPSVTGDLPKGGLLFAGSTPMALKKAAAEAPATPTKTVSGPKTYDGFIAYIRSARPAMANAFENAVCSSFPSTPETDFIVIFSPKNANLYQALLTSLPAVSELQKLTTEYFGSPKRLMVEVKDTGVLSSAEKKEEDFATREKVAKNAVSNHPLIAEARALFGGELGPIELLSSEDSAEKGNRKHD